MSRKTATELAGAIRGGVRQIGQIAILTDHPEAPYALCHLDNVSSLESLEIYRGPEEARNLSTWAEDGHYRFTKGELSLRTGWLMLLAGADDLLTALDGFYPAAVGLWLARAENRLKIQNLRSKLGRQTGMYIGAKRLSDEGIQALVPEVCGPGHCCVKKILWQIDQDTPLQESAATAYPGIVGDAPEQSAIPLLCQEACNHFVAEARRAAKEEAIAAKS